MCIYVGVHKELSPPRIMYLLLIVYTVICSVNITAYIATGKGANMIKQVVIVAIGNHLR